MVLRHPLLAKRGGRAGGSQAAFAIGQSTGKDGLGMVTDRVSVPEIHCDHCKTSLEGALRPIAGVAEATVDVEVRTVTVTYDAAAVDRSVLVEAIEDQGYDVPAR